MIEINLIPDVKQELINAQRVRASVISIAILVGIVAIGVVILLAFWVFVVQTARGAISDNTINTESQKLSSVQDISNTLTIQNQLSLLTQMHNNTNIDSRIFDILTTINPAAPNNVSINNLSIDSSTDTITIQAQALNGYPALDVFKKTIDATTFDYTQNGQKESVPLASQMNDGDRTYGQDASGAQVLRFTLSFTYPSALFARTSQNAVVAAPSQSNVTDSYLGVPQSLFAQQGANISGGN